MAPRPMSAVCPGTHTWVDGGLLTKFPIHSFDRVDAQAPRWPTIGIRLSRFQTEYPSTNLRESAIAIAVRCLKTLMNEWDSLAAHESTVDWTIFVDNNSLSAMDFDLTKHQQEELFLNGVRGHELRDRRRAQRTDPSALSTPNSYTLTS